MYVVHDADRNWKELDHGETRFRRQHLAAGTDAERLGCSLYELPPGAKAWPFHYHTGNEEAFYVLAGEGQVRGPDDHHSVTAGDYVTCLAGEAGGHQFVNDGDQPLRYLSISTMREPDVSIYPDSEKFGVFAGAAPGSDGERHEVSGYYRLGDDVDYWDGEA
jgi:uncharacterized cupin superfamily protein